MLTQGFQSATTRAPGAAAVVRDHRGLTKIIEESGITIRDFMVLAFISEHEIMDVGQVGRHMGLRRKHVVESACRLIRAGLADAELPVDPNSMANRVVPSNAGRSLAERIRGT